MSYHQPISIIQYLKLFKGLFFEYQIIRHRSLYVSVFAFLTAIFTIFEVVVLALVATSLANLLVPEIKSPEIPGLMLLPSGWFLVLAVFVVYIFNYLFQILMMFNIQRLGADLSVVILETRSKDAEILVTQANNGQLVTDIGVEINRLTQQFLGPISTFITKITISAAMIGFSATNWPMLTLVICSLLVSSYGLIWVLSRSQVKNLSALVATLLQERISLVDSYSKGYKFFWSSKHRKAPIEKLKEVSNRYADSQTKVMLFSLLPRASIEMLLISIIATIPLITFLFSLGSTAIQTSEVIQLAVIGLRLMPNLSSVFGSFVTFRANSSSLEVLQRNGDLTKNSNYRCSSIRALRPESLLEIKLPENFVDSKLVVGIGNAVLVDGISGSGKTTFLDGLVGLRSFSGKVTIDGFEVSSLREYVSYVPQDNFIFEGSISQNLYITEVDIQEDFLTKVWTTCELETITGASCNLDFPVYPGRISGGQRQRIALARSLLERKPIVIFDEAFSGIDSASSIRILEKIRDDFGLVVLFISHDKLLKACSDTVVVLRDPEI